MIHVPSGFFLVEIRGDGPCRQGAHRLHIMVLLSWLRQVQSYLKDAGMAGLAFAWAMARRRPNEYRHKADATTRCCGVCTHTWPDLYEDSVFNVYNSYRDKCQSLELHTPHLDHCWCKIFYVGCGGQDCTDRWRWQCYRREIVISQQ